MIRPARRPAGWIPTGPPPAAPAERSELWPAPDEDLCYLAGDWRILQRRRGHRWSLDDLVTAAFAAEVAGADRPARILDLGCGIGAVLLLLAWKFPASHCLGIEAQAASAALARRSIEWNGCGDRCRIQSGDLRDPNAIREGAVFDLVTATPPYLPLGTATPPRREQQPGCHLELRGGVEEYCAAASRALASGGRVVLCHSSRERVESAARSAGLVVFTSRDVVPRAGKAPLFAVHALRREAIAENRLPPLVVRDAAGRWTEEFRALRAAMGMPATTRACA